MLCLYSEWTCIFFESVNILHIFCDSRTKVLKHDVYEGTDFHSAEKRINVKFF